MSPSAIAAPTNTGAGESAIKYEDRPQNHRPVPGVVDNLHVHTLNGLRLVRAKVAEAVDAERAKLRKAAHSAETELTKVRAKVIAEKGRAKLVWRKCLDKRVADNHVTTEYVTAHTVFVAAKKSELRAVDPDQKRARGQFSSVCERLVNSWSTTVEDVRQKRQKLEFKRRQQMEIVQKMTNELEAAEKQYNFTVAHLDTSVTHLQAVSDLLNHL